MQPPQISEWILLVFAYTFVAARIYTRIFRLRQKLDWSDYLLIASALDALGLIICDTLTYQMGVLDDYESSVKLSKVSSSLQPRLPVFIRVITDLLLLKLLLRLRNGLPQTQHARLLLGLF